MRFRRSILAALCVATGVVGLPASHATSMGRPMTLAALVKEAPTIVTGTVTDVTTGRSGSLTYVEVTLAVTDRIRGAAADTLTFRQLGMSGRQPAESGRVYVGALPGMPHYTRGERVLLFLGRESVSGFRTTVGLEQGKFVFAGGNVQNEMSNRGLFRESTPRRATLSTQEKALLATTEGVVDGDTLVSLIERGVAGNWWGAPTLTGGGGTGGKKTPQQR